MLDKVLSTVLTSAMVLLVGAYIHRNYFTHDSESFSRSTQITFSKTWKQDMMRVGVSSDTTKALQVIEFVDFECPACRNANAVLTKLEAAYPLGRTLVHFPLNIHPHARTLAKMAECAGLNRFWRMHDVIFAFQDSLGSKPWPEFAAAAGVKDLAGWTACLESAQGESRIDAGVDLARQYKLPGTPGTIVNGWVLGSGISVGDSATMAKIFDAVLAGKKPVVRQ